MGKHYSSLELPDGTLILAGSGGPEASVTAPPGSRYFRSNGEESVKLTGTGNTGWSLITSSTQLGYPFTPEQYGAVGNGVADDGSALNACFAAAGAANSAVVMKPGATYKTTVALTWVNGLVQLDGRGATIQFTSSTFDLLSLGQPGLTQVSKTGGYVRNLSVFGPGGDDANAVPPSNGKAGIVWNSTRHARTINCTVNNVDIAYDLRGNCYGHKYQFVRSMTTCNVGILLRGGSGLIAGSGSDIQVTGFWGGGHKAAFWLEGNAGGYWFTDCKPGGGWQSAPAPVDHYGVWVAGPTYEAQTTVTAAVAVNAGTITVADASKLFTNEILINGQEIEVLSKSGNTLTVATTATGGWQANRNVKTAIPVGAGVQVTSGVGNVSIKGGGIEGTHDMHALRFFRDVAGGGARDFSFYSNGSGGLNQMISVLKHTGEGSCSFEFENCIVQGAWTGATPITMTTLWKDANQITEIGTTHNYDVPPSFNSATMNLIDRPMVSWSQVKGGLALAPKPGIVFMGGRGLRVNAGALEVSTDAALSGWSSIGGKGEFPGPVRVVNTNGYVIVLTDEDGLITYDVGGTAGTYFLPTNAPAKFTVSVSQGFSGQLTVSAAGSSGPDGIRTPTGIFGTVKTKSSGSIIKFVKDSGTRWFSLAFGDSYTAP